MLADLKHAFRLLGKSPGFTFVAVVSLALAIGVNSAVFSLVNSALLRPFVSDHPEQVVNVFTGRKDAQKDYRSFSYAEYSVLAEPNEVFSSLGAAEFTTAGVEIGQQVRRSIAFFVSDGYFKVRSSRVAMGRLFNDAESRPGAGIPVAILSHSLWKRLGGVTDIIGGTVKINGIACTVIGVMPADFSGGNAIIGPELWLPFGMRDVWTSALTGDAGRSLTDPHNCMLGLTGRLKPGLTLAAAQSRLSALEARIDALKTDAAAGPRTLELQSPSRFSLSTQPTNDGSVGGMAALLLAMAGIVLVIACLNLANMMLARSAARAREFAIRLAIGAPRSSIIRQIVIEGAILSVAGGLLGLLLSAWANDALLQSLAGALSTLHFAFTVDFSPDWRVLGATFVFCSVATLGFSLGPGLNAARNDVLTELKQGSLDAGAHRWSRFFSGRQLLMMGQIALSLVLLFAAGLFFRGAREASRIATGFSTEGGIVAEFDYSLGKFTSAQMLQRASVVLEHAEQLPGARTAALATLVPFGAASDGRGVTAPNAALGTDGKPVTVGGAYCAVTSNYFDALGLKLLQGRVFSPQESLDPAAAGVAIIDQVMADKLFPQGNALGQRIRITQANRDGTFPEMQVVGIVPSFRNEIFSRTPQAHLFVPFAHEYSGSAFLHVRMANTRPEYLTSALKQISSALRAIDASFPLLEIQRFSDLVDRNIEIWVVRLGATVFGLFAVIALVLSAIGIYGVKAYTVARRTREFGIRMAIGARSGDIFSLVMRQSALQLAVSLTVGLLLSLLVGQALASILYRVSPFDGTAVSVSVAVLSSAAIVAAWVPANRAVRVQPSSILRSD